jgi:hypothetical protein
MYSALRQRLDPHRASPESAIDSFVELYVTWREHAAGVTCAYDEWAVARDADERAVAFAVFCDVLDYEARAAKRYAEFMAHVDRMLEVSGAESSEPGERQARVRALRRPWHRWRPE